jgi:acyl-CoA thioester hydrolase
MITHTSSLRVRYADTDQMRFVYYGKYFEYFEQARAELLRSLGFPYAAIEAKGIFLPVIETHASYFRPARYDDLLTIESTVREIPAAKLTVEYLVRRNGEATLLAEGYTIHSFMNAATGKPTRAPHFFLELLRQPTNGTVQSPLDRSGNGVV